MIEKLLNVTAVLRNGGDSLNVLFEIVIDILKKTSPRIAELNPVFVNSFVTHALAISASCA